MTEVARGTHVSTEEIASGHSGHGIDLGQPLRLRPLAGPRWTHQQHPESLGAHAGLPSVILSHSEPAFSVWMCRIM